MATTKDFYKRLDELKKSVIKDIREELNQIGGKFMFTKPVEIDDHISEGYLQGVGVCSSDEGITLIYEDYSEEGDYVLVHPVSDLIYILKELREQYARQEYSFVPGYYEWHFLNKKGEKLLVLNDPSDHCYDTEGNPIEDFQQLKDDMLNEIQAIRMTFEEGYCEEVDGNTEEMLEQLPEDDIVADIIAKALWDYYIAE